MGVRCYLYTPRLVELRGCLLSAKERMKKYILLFTILALLIWINLYYRSWPINFPQLRAQARAMVIDQGVKPQIIDEIQQKFPRYDPIAKDKLLNEKLAEFTKLGKSSIDTQTNVLWKKMKDPYRNNLARRILWSLLLALGGMWRMCIIWAIRAMR